MIIKIYLAKYKKNLENCCPVSATWVQWHGDPNVEGWEDEGKETQKQNTALPDQESKRGNAML